MAVNPLLKKKKKTRMKEVFFPLRTGNKEPVIFTTFSLLSSFPIFCVRKKGEAITTGQFIWEKSFLNFRKKHLFVFVSHTPSLLFSSNNVVFFAGR